MCLSAPEVEHNIAEYSDGQSAISNEKLAIIY